jgi:hypothetical protein
MEEVGMTSAGNRISVGFCEGQFPPGMHICYMYSDPTERLRVLARYYAAGRQANERLVLIWDGSPIEEVSRELERQGVPPGDDFSVLTPPAQEAFSVDKMLGRFKKFYETSLERGYSGGRGSGEMAWAARDPRTVITYEAQLTQVLTKYPTTAVCRYDVNLFSGATIMDVLSTHPYSIVNGQVIKNPYFIDPAQFLERYRAARS